MSIVQLLKPILKAIVASVATAVGAWIGNYVADFDIDAFEAVLMSLVNGGLVWLIPNLPAQVHAVQVENVVIEDE